MVSQKVTISNPSGIHARPAANLAKVAGSCRCDVQIIVGEKRVQAKSVLNLMAAGIKTGTEVVIECNGEDEAEGLKKVVDAIESGLGE